MCHYECLVLEDCKQRADGQCIAVPSKVAATLNPRPDGLSCPTTNAPVWWGRHACMCVRDDTPPEFPYLCEACGVDDLKSQPGKQTYIVRWLWKPGAGGCRRYKKHSAEISSGR